MSLLFFYKEGSLKGKRNVLEEPENNGRVIFVTFSKGVGGPKYLTRILPTFDRPATNIGPIETVETKWSMLGWWNMEPQNLLDGVDIACTDTAIAGIMRVLRKFKHHNAAKLA
jgi:hypothetical protein